MSPTKVMAYGFLAGFGYMALFAAVCIFVAARLFSTDRVLTAKLRWVRRRGVKVEG